MATKATQKLITDTALKLFNEFGTKAISTNRIADECQMSRGNLHYHFRTKEEIVHTIFGGINREMEASWYTDHLEPSMEKMHFMFVRQIKLIWRYRFLYRELNSLLLNDEYFKMKFMQNRRRRYAEIELFFEKLVAVGLMSVPSKPVSMRSLLTNSWLISDQWLAHLDMHNLDVNETSISQGFELIMHIFYPYLTEDARMQYRAISN